MPATSIAIALHVGAGAVWVLSSLAVAITRWAAPWLLVPQTIAAPMTVAAGIYLWHALHAGPQGPAEHLLTLGTFAALIGLGLQLGVVVPALTGASRTTRRLDAASLTLYRTSTVFLVLAAAAMIGARPG